MTKENILIITPEFPPFTNWGGIATFSKNLARLQHQLGKNVYVLTHKPTDNDIKRENNSGYKVLYVPFKTKSRLLNFAYYHFPFGILRFLLKKFTPEILFLLDWNVFSFVKFLNIKKTITFSEIHTQSYYPTFIGGHNLSKKVITHIQGPLFSISKFESKTLGKTIYEKLEILFLKQYSDTVIACSEDVKSKIQQAIPQIYNKVLVIPNFIELKEYKNNASLDINNIVYWGRLDYRKGVDILLSTFKDLSQKNKKMKLFLIGEACNNFILRGKRVSFDEYLGSLKISQSTMNKIYIFPRIDNTKTLIHLLKSLKGLAVFPSRYEPFGYVNIEAMALGFLLLTSNQGAGKDIVAYPNSQIFYPSKKALYRKIDEVYKTKMNKINKCIDESKTKVSSVYNMKAVKKFYK